MSDEPVFRFLSIRPADIKKKREREPEKTPLYPPPLPESDLPRNLGALGPGASRPAIERLVTAFKSGPRYVRRLDDLPFDVQKGLTWVIDRTSGVIADIDVAGAVSDLYGQPAGQVVASAPFLDSLGRIADTLLAEALVPTLERGDNDQLTAAHKFMVFLQSVAAGDEFPEGSTIGAVVANRVIIIPALGKSANPAPPPSPPPPPPDQEEEERDRLKKRVADLEQAHRELSDVAMNAKSLSQPRRAEDEVTRLAGLEGRLAALEMKRAEGTGRKVSVSKPSNILPGSGAIVLTNDAFKSLSETTKGTLRDLKQDPGTVDPIAATTAIERELTILGSKLAATESPTSYIVLGGITLEAKKLKKSLGVGKGTGAGPDILLHTCDFQAGVGDLLIVKQKLKAYELAEFAHVENVLAGESREREHRRLNQREEIEISEEERETAKERDLQSTERSEMQAEAEKTVKSQFGLEAGLQVSGSYGPSVSFAAHLNASFSTTSEETQRKSVSYSKEVTEKTSERVRERVRREVRRRVFEEVQEINKHGINNSPPTNGHIRGIYRWLNKVYDAQIFNYGQRMMYEFVVPEPAAYFLYAMVENPPVDHELVKPDPPTYFGAPLKPSHLKRTNYHDYVAKYQVRNVPAPPPEFQHIAYFDKQDQVKDGTDFGRAGKVEIPVGYEAYAATVATDYLHTLGEPHCFNVMLGHRQFDRTGTWGSDYQDLGTRHRELSVAYLLFEVWAFTLGVDVYCRLTADGLAKWQHAVYDSIIEAYLRQKSDYDEKIAALSIRKGIPILGRNPLENQRLTREELKKLVLMMLTGSTSIALDSFHPWPEPTLRLDNACKHGSRIRFFENAFEWNNMMYVLYSYFWGRKPRWISMLHIVDPDLEFAAFLRAGAARVQVPVRPGFERAVAHFCQFQEIWEGNDPPLRDDDLYVPVVDEIAANLGKFDVGVPYPEGSGPWEVRVPTDLVLVQNLEEIPNIRDILTGNNIALE